MLAGSEIFSLEMSKTEALTQVLTQLHQGQSDKEIEGLQSYKTLQAVLRNLTTLDSMSDLNHSNPSVSQSRMACFSF